MTDSEYQTLLEFRLGLRRFLDWSGEQAKRQGITPTQHLLLLAIRGRECDRNPAVGEVAELLQLRHNSAVELVDRAEAAGLVARATDPDDQRIVRIGLTPEGDRVLEEISRSNLGELTNLAPHLRRSWESLGSIMQDS